MGTNKQQNSLLNSHSLAFQQIFVMVITMLVVGGAFLSVGVTMFTNGIMQQMLDEGGDRVSHAVASLTQKGNPIDVVRRVQNVYSQHGAEQNDPDYYRWYADITSDPEYRSMEDLLRSYTEARIVDACFIAYPLGADGKTHVVVMSDDPKDDTYTIGVPARRLGGIFKTVVDFEDERIMNAFDFTIKDGFYAISSAYLDPNDPKAGSLYFAINTDDLIVSIIAYIIRYAVLMLIIILIELFFTHRRMRRTLVNPLESIANAAYNYSQDQEAGSLGTRHFSALDIQADNEIGHLASVLVSMEGDLYEYMENIRRITAEQERKNAELRMAAQIQHAALPDAFPAFPDRPEFEVFASMDAAREVGGDFYDFFLVDDDHLCLVIADVSDKGVPAALFMMTSKTTLANHVMMGKSPAEALADTNDALCASNDAGMFVTVWVGVLQLSTGVLTAANGGHEYPVLRAPGGGYALYRDRHGLVVGGMPGMRYADYRVALEPGSRLFVYTDGVPEATGAGGEMFGLDRMVEALNAVPDAAPREALAAVRRAVDEFVGDAEQFDDLTMLCLEYRGADARPQNNEKGIQ